VLAAGTLAELRGTRAGATLEELFLELTASSPGEPPEPR